MASPPLEEADDHTVLLLGVPSSGITGDIKTCGGHYIMTNVAEIFFRL